MTLHTYMDVEQRSEEWLALRCGMVTASVVGQLVTMKTPNAADVDCDDCGGAAGMPCINKRNGSPMATTHAARTATAKGLPPVLTIADNETARGLADFLAAERTAGIDPDGTFVNRDMFRGVMVEAPAREKYAEHYGVEVTECGFLVLEENGHSIGVSPDGLVGDDGGIEIKSPRHRSHLRTAANGEVPSEHMAQIQTALMVSGRKWWDLVSYSPGMRLWVKRVLPDADWFRAIRTAVAALEDEIARAMDDYEAAVAGFPMTERLDLEVVI